MAAERLEEPVIAATHETLGQAIGCRRAGVTVALHCLEGAKLIRSTRGKVKVLDREKLALFAADGVQATLAIAGR